MQLNVAVRLGNRGGMSLTQHLFLPLDRHGLFR